MRTAVLANLLALAFAVPAAAQAPAAAANGAEHAIVALPDAIKWGPAPASLPPGAQLAVIEGNPAEPGAFTMRLRMPAGYRIPPHFHRAHEHVTVIRGTFLVGMGEKFDESAMTALPAGSFGVLPPEMRHYAKAQDETIIQLHGTGPWGIYYVNPADDPRVRKE